MPQSSTYGTRLEPHIRKTFQQIINEHGLLNLGLNGGTFNPIHDGHLLVAQAALEQFGLHAILWYPNGNPPHKPNTLDKEYRIAMVKAATKSNPRFFVTRLEADRPGLSYTNITIRQLREELGPNVRFNLIFGADNVTQLATWEGGEELIRECRLLIAARLTCDNNGGEHDEIVRTWREQLPTADLERINCPMHAISSTTVRELVKAARSVEYYVPPTVNKIIQREALYK